MSSKTLVKKLVVLAGALTVLGTGSVAFADEHGPFYAHALGMKSDTAKITVTPAPSRASPSDDVHGPFYARALGMKSDLAKSTLTTASSHASTPNDPHKPFGYPAQLTRG